MREFNLMKRQTTLAMFGILFAAAMALGMVSVSGFSQPLFVASTTEAKVTNQMGMFGHITLTATDPDGENCVAESLFNVTTTDGTHKCDGTGTHSGISVSNGVADGGFTYIAIGDNPTTFLEGAGNTTLAAENVTIGRVKDTNPSVTESTANAGSSAIVTLTGVFTATGATTVDESGIFDAENNGNMLARKTFNTISLAANDKLTVEWEITIGS